VAPSATVKSGATWPVWAGCAPRSQADTRTNWSSRVSVSERGDRTYL
jgi:hypothetical protein